ncbi:MAG: hypothetical protein AAF633_07955, partial [Chloroflexota bacterium]
FRRHFWTFVGIAAVIQVFVLIFQIVASAMSFSFLGAPITSLQGDPQAGEQVLEAISDNPAGLTLFIVAIIFLGLALSVAQVLSSGAMARAVGNSYMGEPLSVAEAYSRILPNWRQLVLFMLLNVLFLFLLFIWTIIPCVGWLTGPGMLFYYSGVIVSMGVAILILESKNPYDAIVRAWKLSRDRFWWIVGFMILLSLISSVLITGPAAIVQLGFSYLLLGSISATPDFLVQTINQVVTTLLNTLFIPFQIIAIVLVYFDLRIRSEGFDIAYNANKQAIPAAELIGQAPETTSGDLFRGADLGNFLGLTIAYIAFAAVVAGIFAGIGFLIVGV